MAEVLLLPLMSGSLGVVALLYYQWWRWQQQLAQQCNDDVSRQIRPVSQKLTGWEFKILRSRRNQFHDPGSPSAH